MPDLGVPQDSDDIEVPYSESSSCSLLKETKPKSYRHPPCWLGSLIAISLLVLVTVTCAIYHFATYVSVSPRPIFNPYPCGTTPSAAREAGCQFDFVIFGWVPDACFDSELSEEFYHLKDGTQSATGYGWPWRTELWNKTQVSSRQVEKGEMDLYTSWEYHYRHCFYTFVFLFPSDKICSLATSSYKSFTAGKNYIERIFEVEWWTLMLQIQSIQNIARR